MNKKKQIVFVNQSSGYLMIDIVNEFRDVYEERILMAGFLNPRNNPIDDNVKIEKITTFNRSSFMKRIGTWALGFLKVLWLIKTKYRNADLFLVSNPPFTTFIPLLCSNPYKILIYDIYPDALVEFKYLKDDSTFVKLWKKANKKVFSKAQKVYTLTDGMKNRILAYTNEENIQIVPIWTDNEFLKPIEKSQNKFLLSHNIADKFVIMYSGNMGKAHPVEILIELAVKFRNDNDIFFLLIGGGEKYQKMESLIQKNNLHNIIILPWQDTSVLPFTLSGADLALVTVGNEASDLSIPSKTYNLMSVGTPIICVAPPNAALARLVESDKIGVVFQNTELDKIADFINSSVNETCFLLNYKNNGLRASINYTPKNAKQFI